MFLKSLSRFQLILLIGVVALMLCSIRIYSVDDPFVYYNYAKRFVDGRFFAFDNRNIPSEGFTSLLYVLLLVPFEFFKINLPWSSVILNVVSLFLSVRFAYLLFFKTLKISTEYSFGFIFSLLLLIYIQRFSIFGLLGFGLESYVALALFVMMLYYFFELFFNQISKKTLASFLLLYFLLFLTRPESIAMFFPLIVLLFFHKIKEWKLILPFYIAFLVIFVLFMFWKYLFFGDIWPTGYYRKMNMPQDPVENGTAYVLKYLYTSRLNFVLIVVSALVLTYLKVKELTHKNLWITIGVMSLCWVFNCGFVMETTPIVGFFMRYVVFANFLLCAVAALAFTFVIHALKKTPLRILMHFSLLSLVFPFLYYAFYTKIPDVYSDNYEKIGKTLQKNFKNPSQINFSAGDAGAIQYYFEGNFIDFNGLTEPKIAKLFKEKHNANHATQDSLIAYLNSQKTDFIIYQCNTKIQEISVGFDYRDNPHTPLTLAKTFDFIKKLKLNAYEYYGTSTRTGRFPYDLVYLVNKKSDNYQEIKQCLNLLIDKNSPDSLLVKYQNQKFYYPLRK